MTDDRRPRADDPALVEPARTTDDARERTDDVDATVDPLIPPPEEEEAAKLGDFA